MVRRAAQSGWPGLTGEDRARCLDRLADGVENRRHEFAKLDYSDAGKPMREALADVDEAVGAFRYYARLARGLDSRQDERVDVDDSRFGVTVRREPLGVVAAIVPWNYPLLMLAWKAAPALAAGCTVVVKPSELSPRSAVLVARIAAEALQDPAALQVAVGAGETGAALAAHPMVAKVAFTGSLETGRRVMAAAAERVAPVTLELGGKSPMLVFDDAPALSAVLEWVLMGIVLNQGQVCSATSRLLVQRAAAEKLLPQLAAALTRADVAPLVSRAQMDKVVAFIDEARRAGIPVLAEGPPPPPSGFFVSPIVFKDVPVSSRLWREEVFGPVLAVRVFDSEDEALALANDSHYGLAAAVMTSSDDRARRLSRALHTGTVWINCSQPAFIQAPWGGVKQSGFGRELGPWGLESYLYVKTVTTNLQPDEPTGWY